MRWCVRLRSERRRLLVAMGLLALILAGAALAGQWTGRQGREPTIRVTGPEEVVFDWSEAACAREDFPDVPARAFRDAQGQVQLLASHFVSRRMIGSDLDTLTRDCAVVMDSHRNPDPAMFDGWEWLHAFYTLDGTTIVALVHNEFQGHRFPALCPSGKYWQCWYNAVTLAISRDGGASFEHAAPPTHLVAAGPYPYEPDAGPFGVFNPSNIVRHPGDGYYYTLVNVPAYGTQPGGICVMRTNDLMEPSAWRAWDGTGFGTAFANPYAVPNPDPAAHICEPVSTDQIQMMRHSVTFNTYLQRFLLIGVASAPDPVSGEPRWGTYFALSDDLIHWTPRRLLMEHEVQSTFECGDEDPAGYPALLDPDSPSPNFETSDQQAYLYFVRIHYSSCQATLARDLVRVPITISD